MNFYKIFINIALLIIAPNIVLAVEPINSKTENRVYVGLTWGLNSNVNYLPDLSFGVRSMRLDSDNFSNGADLSLLVKYQNSQFIDSMRLLYVGGSRDTQINLGGGYSFSKNSPFAATYLQIPNIRIGTDYLVNDREFNSNIEVNNLGRLGSFSECPFNDYRIVPEQYQATVNDRTVVRTRYLCVKVSH